MKNKVVYYLKSMLLLLLCLVFISFQNTYSQTTRIEVESTSGWVESFGPYINSWGITTVGAYTGKRSGGTGNWRGRYFIFTPGTYNINLGWYDNNASNYDSELWLQIGARTNGSKPPVIQSPAMDVDHHWKADQPEGAHVKTYLNVQIGATDTIFLFDYQVGSASNSFWDYIEFTKTSSNPPSPASQSWGISNNIISNNPITTNIGIGTTCIPSDGKLAVNGKIYATEVQVKLTDANGCFPDYVFDSNYKLISLEEVEKYINENKHLPEVPSAKEVGEKGINLGDMDALLLKKVEELTLYSIEQQKLIKQQVEMNEKLFKMLQEQAAKIKEIQK